MTTNERIRLLLDKSAEHDRTYDFNQINEVCSQLKDYFGVEGLAENRMASDSSLLMEFVRKQYPNDPKTLQSLHMVSLLPFWKWSHSKVTYTFDPDVEAALVEQRADFLDGQTPYELLSRLPHPVFFVATNIHVSVEEEEAIVSYRTKPSMPERLGFFFAVDEVYVPVVRDNIGIYWIVRTPEDGKIHVIPSYWDMTRSVSDILEEAFLESNQAKKDRSRKERFSDLTRMALAMQYVLYLCAENAEIRQEAENAKYFRSPTPGFIKHKPREVKILEAGMETGIRLREFRQKQSSAGSGSGVSGRVVAPHVRRAHWHRYWVGPRDNKSLRIKWIAPIQVHKELIGVVRASNVRLHS